MFSSVARGTLVAIMAAGLFLLIGKAQMVSFGNCVEDNPLWICVQQVIH